MTALPLARYAAPRWPPGCAKLSLLAMQQCIAGRFASHKGNRQAHGSGHLHAPRQPALFCLACFCLAGQFLPPCRLTLPVFLSARQGGFACLGQTSGAWSAVRAHTACRHPGQQASAGTGAAARMRTQARSSLHGLLVLDNAAPWVGGTGIGEHGHCLDLHVPVGDESHTCSTAEQHSDTQAAGQGTHIFARALSSKRTRLT